MPTWLAMTQIALYTYVYLAMVSILVYAPVWVLGGLIRRKEAKLNCQLLFAFFHSFSRYSIISRLFQLIGPTILRRTVPERSMIVVSGYPVAP